MSTTSLLNQNEIRQRVGDIFVYQMPFNGELGLALNQFTPDSARLSFAREQKLIGNALQQILHGGVIAAALDVAAGLVCIGNALLRESEMTEEELLRRMARMGTIDIRVDYLRPGRGEHFTLVSHLLRAGNKVAVARADLHNEQMLHIASATGTWLVG
ncbi:thioesterase family protein [Affinibrenneria salicis]|uniref:Thioesterase family protein n=1 Tax=Affinibrenneria salicis TaxID=2590031 RepID=A0A5J5FU36_9GAMM|nr:thioesterase family protein [Affinibrenneria salicis]KAA8996426.1 thioesterase family protein [Affinibrenneria salicis]